MVYIEVLIVVVLIIINGLLAMSELAIVSSRPARLKAMADKGSTGAAKALVLAGDPGRFLSTVQIGITMVGVLSGAFSGATLGQRLSGLLIEADVPAGIANAVGVGLVVAAITYGSLIIGELVPKQIALRNPEGVSARVAPAMAVLAVIGAPLVWFLDVSGRAVLQLLGQKSDGEERVTDEEIKSLIAEAEGAGVIETDERAMIAGVMRLADRTVRGIMTPRTDVDWVNVQSESESVRQALIDTPHSRLPAGDGSVDDMVGVIQTRELLAAILSGTSPLDIKDFVRQAPIIHDNADALAALTTLKEASVPMALVHDEHGHFEGIVTPADVLEAITGAFRSDYTDDGNPNAVQREDGSWLLAGYMPADEMADILKLTLPEDRDYETLAGFVLAQLAHLPATGESVDALGWRFEVVDLDGRRIDKVIAHPLAGVRLAAG
ncbi:hemolysin family protein [Tianweitania sediminis]|uniref:HlyC/CorC family transporter n=1 Tax=Tianweitania sediminis TaxID=1502156 RepID=A0A8J7RJ05_9HYPH|nr:hemolysin family protein [Tianweitania sediminis]MBP0439316.1 HlyC/CorC family transporter [Tianweitania sediminis]